MSRPTDSLDCDVAIAGGGLIGASLACALAPLGYRVAVIESVAYQAPSQPSFDDRTLALSRSSCCILQGIGIWPHLQPDATPIRRIIVTERGWPGRVLLDPAEMGLESFGHVVEARSFGAAVQARLAQFENIDLVCPASVTGLERSPGEVRVTIAGRQEWPSELRARLLVAADGASSTIRGLLDIPVLEHDYGQTAVICNIIPEIHADGRAFERFTETGPFAILPHTGDRCGLVWSAASDEAERLLGLPEADFLAAARSRFGSDLGDFLRLGTRSAYPLKLVRAQRDSDERVVILGNAAHAIHPVGAQGFNLGCRDIAVLAELLAASSVSDPGESRILAEYSTWRRPDHDGTIALSDGMARLFSNPSPAASLLRSFGLVAHALAPSLRRRMAAGAMGYRGRVPRLAQGLDLAALRP
jgi:2-octaprenyl-6-methoxyphenol hydroxylase